MSPVWTGAWEVRPSQGLWTPVWIWINFLISLELHMECGNVENHLHALWGFKRDNVCKAISSRWQVRSPQKMEFSLVLLHAMKHMWNSPGWGSRPGFIVLLFSSSYLTFFLTLGSPRALGACVRRWKREDNVDSPGCTSPLCSWLVKPLGLKRHPEQRWLLQAGK